VVAHDRGDGVTHPSGPDPREAAGAAGNRRSAAGPTEAEQGLRVQTRSFR
jgi:hypothetical protein